MNISEFLSSVLDKAIRGKLVPQNPSDEAADILIQRIADYKNQLVSQKKLKINKNNSQIIKRGTSYYLKQGKEEKIIDSELPFIIPSNWTWVSLSQVSMLINGDRGKNYPGRQHWIESGVPFINAGALGDHFVKKSELNFISEERYNLLKSGFVEPNDILYCLRGSLGKVAINNIDKGAIASSIVIIRAFEPSIVEFLYLVFISNYGNELINKVSGGTAQPNLSAKNVADYIIPIPPLEEQKRIVKAVETCFSFAELVEQRQLLTKQFKIDLKAGLLDSAVRGKLAPQHPEDEPVLSKFKSLNINNELLEDVPYNLPNGWIWTKLKTISKSIKAGGDKPKEVSSVKTDEFPFPIYANGTKDNGLYGYSKEAKITEQSLTVSARGTIGFSVVRREPYTPIVRLISIVPNPDLICLDYLKIVFDAFYTDGNGTSIPQLTVPQVKEKLIPVPPLQEQKRIVALYEKLIANL